MKKLIALFLVLILLFTAVSMSEDAPETPAAGDWYAELDGILLRLSLNADGTYSLVFSDEPGESSVGTWAADDIFVSLEDGGTLALISENLLIWQENGLRFTHKAPQAYVPADLLQNAVLENYAGYWKCAFVDLSGAIVSAKAVDERTDLYIEDTLVALGGPCFGDIFRDFDFANGALSADVDDQRVTLALQQDACLHLSIEREGETVILYLARSFPNGLEESE